MKKNYFSNVMKKTTTDRDCLRWTTIVKCDWAITLTMNIGYKSVLNLIILLWVVISVMDSPPPLSPPAGLRRVRAGLENVTKLWPSLAQPANKIMLRETKKPGWLTPPAGRGPGPLIHYKVYNS